MPQIELTFSTAVILVVLLLFACHAASFLYYRKTLPPVSGKRRTLLGAIRGTALFFLCFLLFEPLLNVIHSSSEPPVLAVLVDNSQSMGLTDSRGSRDEILRSALSTIDRIPLPKEGELIYYRFGGALRDGTTEPPDTLGLDEESTDLSQALKDLHRQMESKNLQGVLIISDGSSNRGENPVYAAAAIGVPVFAVGIGDSSLPRDLVVSKVLSNELVYANTSVPVDATIRSSGFAGQAVDVTLEGEGKVIDRKRLHLLLGSHDYTVGLSYSPTGEGIKRYKVRVSGLDGELTTRNNAMDFFAKVIKGKLRVLIVAAGPSPDLMIVKNSLEQQPEFSVTTRTERLPEGYYEGTLSESVVDSADCLLLLGVPDPKTSRFDLRILLDAIMQNNTPVFYLAGKTSDIFRLTDLSSLLGITVASSAQREDLVFLRPSPVGAASPLLNAEGRGSQAWDRLPPVFRMNQSVKPRPDAVVLAVPRIQGVVLEDPLLVTRDVAQHKSIALLVYGIWRWKLMTAGDPSTEDLLPSFLSTGIRWLTTRDDNRPLKVATTREFFARGEPVEFTAQLYDETARPIDNAEVKISATKGERSFEASLTPSGNGRYEGTLHGLEEGEYSFTASAVSDERRIAEDHGRFSVGELNLEFRDTRMDAELLRRMATTTGGKFLQVTDLDSLPHYLVDRSSFSPRDTLQKNPIELWNWKYTLFTVVGLFALEWFLRKRSGMV